MLGFDIGVDLLFFSEDIILSTIVIIHYYVDVVNVNIHFFVNFVFTFIDECAFCVYNLNHQEVFV